MYATAIPIHIHYIHISIHNRLNTVARFLGVVCDKFTRTRVTSTPELSYEVRLSLLNLPSLYYVAT